MFMSLCDKCMAPMARLTMTTSYDVLYILIYLKSEVEEVIKPLLKLK